ncbi:MAG TPA: LPS export ABC transporter permease LptF [Legionella sp.]|nr:LPS export ABC transporter permease LptF [Legionella sp.]
MLIFRYLSKEVFVTLVALTSILLLIFMSNQLVLYLNRAASGQIPGVFIMKLMMLELPNLLSLLLPLGFYVSLLVAYGRMYAESEMTVLQACGYGPGRLLNHSFIMASVVALLVLIIMLWGSPLIATARATLLRTTGIQTLIQTIAPGRFNTVPGGQQIFYVESMNRDHTVAKNIFFAQSTLKNEEEQWDLLWAEQARAEMDKKTFEDYVVLENGHKYQGVPGKTDYQVAHFMTYKARLPHPTVSVKADLRTLPTALLWPLDNPNRAKAAELQWRLSVPLMVLTLTLVGVPLSRVNARSGKYAKLLPAIVLYIVYANLMFIARDWLAMGKTPLWLGMWWIHLLVALIGLLLIWRNQVKLS